MGGWYSAENFLSWLKLKLDTGMHAGGPRRSSGLTLKEFYEATTNDVSFLAADPLPVPGADTAVQAAKSFRRGEPRTGQRLANLVNTAPRARDKSVIEAV